MDNTVNRRLVDGKWVGLGVGEMGALGGAGSRIERLSIMDSGKGGLHFWSSHIN